MPIPAVQATGPDRRDERLTSEIARHAIEPPRPPQRAQPRLEAQQLLPSGHRAVSGARSKLCLR
jgi:hypothetical protein